MSVADVTARIQQIQAQLSLLAPPRTSTSGAAFAGQMAAATQPAGVGGAEAEKAVVDEARKYLGLPYVWGGTDPARGMDCSGLVQVVYRSLGYELPRVSYQQAKEGRPVASLAEARPGDLLAWDNSSRNNGVDHIAIYVGNGKMIEAPRTGLNIRLVDVPSTPTVIRRILPEQAVTGVAGATVAPDVGRVSGVPFADLFNNAARAYDVPAALLSAVAKQESGYNPKAVSPAGAQGLMQLMPGTARGLNVDNPFDPAEAVNGGARLLRDLMDRFGSVELALAAYNAGPGAVLRYDGIPPYRETQDYVRKVMALMEAA